MISKKDFSFINMAANEAHNSPCLMRHGCVAVLNGRIIGKGYNNYRCSSRDGFIHNCMTCHAEIAALRQVHKHTQKFKKVVLYVVRLDASNTLQESAPCVDCMVTIKKLNIKRVIHSSHGGKIQVKQPTNYTASHVTNGKKVLSEL